MGSVTAPGHQQRSPSPSVAAGGTGGGQNSASTLTNVTVPTCGPCPTRSAPSTANCCPAPRCGSCSPTTPAPAKPSWPASTSKSSSCATTSNAASSFIVAPGGLVEQWQDELFFKFGLRFDLLTNQTIDAYINDNVFGTHPLLIARMDQLSRNEDLQTQLKDTEWDLVVVDEAHRMAAHYFGGKLEKTKRFQLGELLGSLTRHLLLMTATPHSGKVEDYQLFLTLLDRDRFEGKNSENPDTSGIMHRMIKEDLLTFDGKRLFPERKAETVPYELTELEESLYEQVTDYVREGSGSR